MAGAELSGQLLGGSLQSFPGALRRAFENPSRRLVRKLSAELSGGPPAGCREALRAAVRRFSAQLSRSSSDGGPDSPLRSSLQALQPAFAEFSGKLSGGFPHSGKLAGSFPDSCLEYRRAAVRRLSGKLSRRVAFRRARWKLSRQAPWRPPPGRLEVLRLAAVKVPGLLFGRCPQKCPGTPRKPRWNSP